MAKQKGKAPPTVAPPAVAPPREDRKLSAETMAGLEKLRTGDDTPERAAAVWKLMSGGGGLRDFGVRHDFAREHGLTRSGVGGPPVWVNPADGSEMVHVPGGS